MTHKEKDVFAITPASLLVSRGKGSIPREILLCDALDLPDLRDALKLAIHAPTLVQAIEGVDFPKLGWSSSSRALGHGYDIRTLWIFPYAALLMNNIHSTWLTVRMISLICVS